jgi:hypothetical protein
VSNGTKKRETRDVKSPGVKETNCDVSREAEEPPENWERRRSRPGNILARSKTYQEKPTGSNLMAISVLGDLELPRNAENLKSQGEQSVTNKKRARALGAAEDKTPDREEETHQDKKTKEIGSANARKRRLEDSSDFVTKYPP